MAHLLGRTYLEEIDSTYALKNKGIMWGTNGRLFINLPLRLHDGNCPQNINVIFKVDSGAGITTLTGEVL